MLRFRWMAPTTSGWAPVGDTVVEVGCGGNNGGFEKAKWLGEYTAAPGGEPCCLEGGDGAVLGSNEGFDVNNPDGLTAAPAVNTLDARSKKVPNLPRVVCHSSHIFFDVNRL